MNDRSQLKFALAAAFAGLTWGYLRHRERKPGVFSLLQGLEWFVAYGGAAAVITLIRELLEEAEVDDTVEERITHFRQVVTDRTGTDS